MNLYIGDIASAPLCADCGNPASMVLDIGKESKALCHRCAEELMYCAVDAVHQYKKRMGIIVSNEAKH